MSGVWSLVFYFFIFHFYVLIFLSLKDDCFVFLKEIEHTTTLNKEQPFLCHPNASMYCSQQIHHQMALQVLTYIKNLFSVFKLPTQRHSCHFAFGFSFFHLFLSVCILDTLYQTGASIFSLLQVVYTSIKRQEMLHLFIFQKHTKQIVHTIFILYVRMFILSFSFG